MRRIFFCSPVVVLTACASGIGGTVPGGGIGDVRPPSVDVAVVMHDESPRTALHFADVSVMTYFDDPLPPQGCRLIAHLITETSTPGQMRSAIAHRAGGIGATLAIIANRREIVTETPMSRTGVGRPVVRTRYDVEAYDCR
jgi:hypothetical protein